MDVVIGSVVIAVLFTLLAVYLARKSVADNTTISKSDEKQSTENAAQRTKSQPSQTSKSKETKTFAQKKDHRTHAWLYNSLKGHAVPVDDMDLSPNGKYLISTSADRTLMLWPTKDWPQREQHSIRTIIEFDNAIKCRFAPDSKSVIVAAAAANTIQVYKMVKNDTTKSIKLQHVEAVNIESQHVQDILAVGIDAQVLHGCWTFTNYVGIFG